MAKNFKAIRNSYRLIMDLIINLSKPIQNNKEEIKDINLIIKALSTVFFNQYFIELKDNFNKVIEQKSLAKDYTIQEKLIYPILHFSGLCTMNGRIIQ